MFESLRQAFKEAVDNFNTELRRDEVPEAADRLLRAMKRELVNARAGLSRLETEIGKTRAEAEREEAEARTCVRREEMARRIGDEETVRVARRYAERHLQRKDLLEKKAAVLEQELASRRAEAEEMTERLKEAALQRDSLAATAGRSDARERLQEADDLFDDLERMADRIGDFEARAAAERELDEMDAPPFAGEEPGAAPPPEADVEARLAELKRRMEGGD